MKTFDWRSVEPEILDAVPNELVIELIDRRISDAPNTQTLRQVFDALRGSDIAAGTFPLSLYELAVEIAGMITPMAVVQNIADRGKVS